MAVLSVILLVCLVSLVDGQCTTEGCTDSPMTNLSYHQWNQVMTTLQYMDKEIQQLRMDFSGEVERSSREVQRVQSDVQRLRSDVQSLRSEVRSNSNSLWDAVRSLREEAKGIVNMTLLQLHSQRLQASVFDGSLPVLTFFWPVSLPPDFVSQTPDFGPILEPG